jgi:hypothetical protein
MSGPAPRSAQTPRLGLFKPDPGGDVDVWGDELNANADVLDGALLAQTAAAIYVPLAGGQMTGPLGLACPPTERIQGVAIVGGLITLDFRLGGVFQCYVSADITAMALANVAAGKVSTAQLELIGDGFARVVNFGAWTMATGAPVPTFALARKDIYEIRTDGTNTTVWLTAQNLPT